MPASWSCGHHRAPTRWSNYDSPLAYPLEYWAKHAVTLTARREIAEEVEQRRQKCPACRAQDRRVRRAWCLVIAAALVVLLVGWRIHG